MTEGTMTLLISNDDVRQQARPVRRVQVFSLTREHREAYAAEVRERFEIEAAAMDTPEEAHRGDDIVSGCTDAVVPVIFGRYLDPGTLTSPASASGSILTSTSGST
jgi:alanine dehydrogenase